MFIHLCLYVNYMNKGVIIGLIIIAAVGIGIISLMSSTENPKEILPSDEKIILDEIVSLEENLEEQPKKTGKNITIELKETVGLATR